MTGQDSENVFTQDEQLAELSIKQIPWPFLLLYLWTRLRIADVSLDNRAQSFLRHLAIRSSLQSFPVHAQTIHLKKILGRISPSNLTRFTYRNQSSQPLNRPFWASVSGVSKYLYLCHSATRNYVIHCQRCIPTYVDAAVFNLPVLFPFSLNIFNSKQD